MAYDVLFSMPERTLGRSDVEFIVKSRNAVLGTLKISKGTLVWFPSGAKTGHRMTWTRFDELMRSAPKSERRTRRR